MKSLCLLAATCLLHGLVQAQTHDSLWISPDHPQPGASVTVHFTTDRIDAMRGGLYSLDKKIAIHAQDLLLQKEGNSWTATIALSDTAVAIVANITGSSGEVILARPTGLYGPDGQPLRDGYKALAQAYSATRAALFGMKADQEASKANKNLYWASFTTPPATLFEKLSYALEYKKDTTGALKDMSALPLDDHATEQDYSQAIYLAGRLRNKPLSDILTNLCRQKFPGGEWKFTEYYTRLLNAWSGEDQEKILEECKAAFLKGPSTIPPAYLSSLTDGMTMAIAGSYAREGDVDRALKFVPGHAGSSLRAEVYWDIARNAALADKSLPEATALAKAALDTLQFLESSASGKPDYYTRAQYVSDLKSTYDGLFSDTYGFLLYKTGDYKNAFKYEAIALKSAGGDKGIIEHYHLCMEKVDKPSKVMASLRGYIAQGNADSAMEAQFKRLYRGQGSADDALATLEAKVSAEKKAAIVKTILNEPASGFVLRDLNGNKVSLDSLRGKTVVLDFWATWCGPCKASFPAMQKIVDKHKADNNVVVLFVDTWERGDDKNKNAHDFLTASPYTFHVLMDNDNEVVEKYKVSGIPTKFIIDPGGTLRFKAVGFSGDTDDTVKELEEMIGLAARQ